MSKAVAKKNVIGVGDCHVPTLIGKFQDPESLECGVSLKLEHLKKSFWREVSETGMFHLYLLFFFTLFIYRSIAI